MTAPRHYHVEVQEVFYRRYEIQARHREEAEALVMDGKGLLRRVERVHHAVTTTHEPQSSCAVNCSVQQPAAARVLSMLEANRRALPGGPVVSTHSILEAAGFSPEDIEQAFSLQIQPTPDLERGASFLDPGLLT